MWDARAFGFLHDDLAADDFVLTLASSSGVGLAVLVTWDIRASRRALGTGLPLTVVMFCAMAATGSRAAMAAASTSFFMSVEVSDEGNAPPGARESGGLSARRGSGVQAQGVDPRCIRSERQ